MNIGFPVFVVGFGHSNLLGFRFSNFRFCFEETCMNIAHFVQRYPPAIGGSEAYFARLSRYLASKENHVTVFTTVAKDLEAFWSRGGTCVPSGVETEDGTQVRRYRLARWPGRRLALKALSFLPHHLWQCLTLPCNPIAWQMWTDAGKS